MLDSRSRVTVVGAGKRVDLALPSNTPIGEYVPALARLCGQPTGAVMPPVWSLATADSQPLPVETSLAEAHVLDGQVLYLRDVGRDPGAAPGVEDIDELVADEAERYRRGSAPHGLVTMALGLVWLMVTALATLQRSGAARVSTAIVLLLAGASAVAIGWVLHQLPTPVPKPLCLAVALGALPCLAAAGALFGQSLYGREFRWAGAIAGANVSTLMILAAVPEAVIVALELPLALAAMLAPVLSLVHADGTQVAAAAAVSALALVSVAKPLAGAVTAWSGKLPRSGPSMAQAATALVVRARQLLAVILLGPVVSLGIALPVLAATCRPYPVALVVVTSVALLVRARAVQFTSEVAMLSAAGCVGLFATVAAFAGRYLSAWPATAVLATAGLVILGAGIAATVLRRPAPAAGEDPTLGLGGPVDNPDRFRWLDVIGVMCNIASACLAMGVFGVFGDLFGMGRHIVG